MKSMLALLTTLLLGTGMTACGGDTGRSRSTSSLSHPPMPGAALTGTASVAKSLPGYLNDADNDHFGDSDKDNNSDDDNDNSEDYQVSYDSNYHDSDDSSIVAYGHAAGASDARAVTNSVKRYFAAAAAKDGAPACSMLDPTVTRSIPEDYGHGSAGPAYLSTARTCPAIMVLLFQHYRTQIAASRTVTGVRVQGNHAVAILGSRTVPAGYISLTRRGHTWRITVPIGNPLP